MSIAGSPTAAAEAVRFNPATFSRRTAARHPEESRWSVFAEVYQALLGAAVLLTYAGALLYGIREELLVNAGSVLTRSVVAERFAQMPAQTALAAVLLLAAAGGFLLLLRIGPVSATAAQGYWWLSLPIDRRRALTGPAAGKLLKTAVVAGLGFLPIAALSSPAHGLVSVLLGSSAAGAVGALTFLLAALIQAAGAKRAAARTARIAGIAGFLVLLLPLLSAGRLAGVPAPALLLLPSSWPLVAVHGAMWPLPVALAVILAGICAVYVLLNRLSLSELTSSGSISGHAAGSLYFGDFRELGSALSSAGTSRRFRLSPTRFSPARFSPGRLSPGRFSPIRRSSAFKILVRADVVAFLRSAGKGRNIVVLALLPAALASVNGAGSAVVVAAMLLVSGWAAASVSASVARLHADRPVLDGLLPLTPLQTRRAHAVLPAACLTLWGLGAFGLLAVLGAGGAELPVLGVLAGLGLSGAAMRSAFRPHPDWTNPGGSSISLMMPAGLEASFTRGPDFAVIAMVPALAALVSGDAPWWLFLVQLGSSAFCLWSGTRAD